MTCKYLLTKRAQSTHTPLTMQAQGGVFNSHLTFFTLFNSLYFCAVSNVRRFALEIISLTIASTP